MVGVIQTPHRLRKCANRNAQVQKVNTSERTYAQRMAIRNQGTGLGEGKDEKFPKADMGEGSGLPWE